MSLSKPSEKFFTLEEDLREECDVSVLPPSNLYSSLLLCIQERTGWYSTRAFERIKAILRHKFFSLLSGHVATREECERILGDVDEDRLPTRSVHALRPRKHNMAKGALRPEDAAVSSEAALGSLC